MKRSLGGVRNGKFREKKVAPEEPQVRVSGSWRKHEADGALEIVTGYSIFPRI
jgi:hypothetical protein